MSSEPSSSEAVGAPQDASGAAGKKKDDKKAAKAERVAAAKAKKEQQQQQPPKPKEKEKEKEEPKKIRLRESFVNTTKVLLEFHSHSNFLLFSSFNFNTYDLISNFFL